MVRFTYLTKISFLYLVFSITANVAWAQAQVSESERYLELNSLVLNEPCVQYELVHYKTTWQYVEIDEGIYWDILTGESIEQTEGNCTLINNISLNPNFVRYDVGDIAVARDGFSTGDSVDVIAGASLDALHLGFEILKIINVVEGDSVFVEEDGSATATGPASFPFTYQEGEGIEVISTMNFVGDATYDVATNDFSISLSDVNANGDPECGLLQVYSPVLEICINIQAQHQIHKR